MKKILVNSITFLRILLGLLFFYFVLFDFNKIYLVFIFILTAISDFSDGKLARKFHISSNAGARFDVISDFIFIFLSTLSLVLIDLIPFWFLFIIILKLLEFFITSGNKKLKYEKFGHFVALMFYAFPIFAILINSKNITLMLSILISVCAVASSILRIKNLCEK